MATFFIFGKYTNESLQKISPKRTKQVESMIHQKGGQVLQIYGLLGQFDLVVIADLPGIESAFEISLSLTKITGIGFTSVPAVEVKAFDEIADRI